MNTYEKNRPLTLRELEAIIEEMSDNEEVDVAYIPPEVDNLTDEEFIDDEETGAMDKLPTDLAGTFEILTNDIDDSTSTALHLKSDAPKYLKKLQYNKPIWRNRSVHFSTAPVSDEESKLAHITETLHGKSPLELFNLFFDEEIISMIINFTNTYAQDNNRPEFCLKRTNLLKFLAVLILSGYHSLPQTDMYWSSDSDKGIEIVRNALSRKQFRDIKRNIHLSDNKQLNKDDKFAKLRPLFDAMNKNFLQFGIFRHNLSIDEEMVPYFGRHSAKMFIKGKPVRFGFKLWCLASSDGYLYKFEPYAGKNNSIPVNPDLGLSGSVVAHLVSIIENPNQHKIYFDNFFTSYKLLVFLKQQGFHATGTVRENRLENCPIDSTKLMKKKERGAYAVKYDHENAIAVTRWNDNSVVTLATNFESTEPILYTKRYNRKERKDVQIPQPTLISQYNKSMGGVDLHDNGVANYRIKIRGKKWWWPLFINLVDSVIVNAWKIHRIVYNEKPISQLEFRSYIVRTLLQQEDTVEEVHEKHNLNLRGRPPINQLPAEIRYDNVGHVIERHPKNYRRRCRHCKSTTIYYCKKCNVHLHTPCFSKFHKK